MSVVAASGADAKLSEAGGVESDPWDTDDVNACGCGEGDGDCGLPGRCEALEESLVASLMCCSVRRCSADNDASVYRPPRSMTVSMTRSLLRTLDNGPSSQTAQQEPSQG